MAVEEIDTHVSLGGLEMSTPLTTASGTFGYGTEYAGAVDYAALGAVTVKGIRRDPWPGNPMPRHVEVPGGLVNAIGLQGPGVAAFIEHYLPHYDETVREAGFTPPPVIVNIWGGSIEEYADVAKMLDATSIGAIEMNVSCPNVKAGGHTFGQDVGILREVVMAVRAATRKPLIVKLAPNVPDIGSFAKTCEEAGADAVSLINTIPAMVIDVEKRFPILGNRTGGLSGRAVHPVAVKAVYDVHRATTLPILAMGGVYDWKDAAELMLAGATAVAIGTALFTDPSAPTAILAGLKEYAARQGFATLREMTGALAG